jgi:hypothetical protein
MSREGHPMQYDIDFNLLAKVAKEIALLNTSSAKKNNKGDKVSPCRTPLEQGKNPTALSLIKIDKRAD